MRRQRLQKLTIRALRIGESKRLTVHTARDAARRATALTSKGFRVMILDANDQILMACSPKPRGAGRMNIAKCDLSPTFKRQVRGLAGTARRSRRSQRARRS